MSDRSGAAWTILALLTFLPCGACGDGEEPAEPIVRPVRHERVVASAPGVVRTFAGTARAGVESRLSFKVSGNVRRLAVSVGDSVRMGGMIAEIDPRDYELQVENAEANLKNLVAQAKNARASYDRVRGLYENKNASLADLEAAEAAADSARAAVDAAEKQLELAQLRLSYTRLTAPAAGAISEVLVEVNENVREGQAIVELSAGAAPEIAVALPEQMIADVRKGQPATVTFDAIPGRTFDGVVSEVGVAPTGAATTFPVTVELAARDPGVRPGMSAEVRMTFGEEGAAPRYLVRLSAVGEDRLGRFVFVVEADDPGFGRVRRRSVTVSDQVLTGERIEVLEGLAEGELVVTAGLSRIEDGMRVRLGAEGEPAS